MFYFLGYTVKKGQTTAHKETQCEHNVLKLINQSKYHKFTHLKTKGHMYKTYKICEYTK